MNFSGFIPLLESELSLYSDLLVLESEKTAVIISGDIDRLNEILLEEQVLTKKTSNAERLRTDYVAGTEYEGKTLLQTIEGASGEEADKLGMILGDFHALTQNIKRVNEYNSKVLTFRMNLVSDIADIIADADKAAGIPPKTPKKTAYYDAGGTVDKTGSDPGLLKKKM